MMRLITLFFLLFLNADIALADVTPPAGTLPNRSNLDFYRAAIYKLSAIYLADTSSNTMLVQAPSLADDNTVFTLPATNGSAGQPLIGNGSGALSYGDPTITSHLTMTEVAAPSTPASGTVAVYAKTDGKLYRKDDSGAESEIGSGAGGGSGFENWVENGGAEDTDISSVTTYDDGASATPVDCSGGSPSAVSAASRNTSSPIQGDADYSLAKGAANGQGEGWAFTVALPANNPAAVAGWQASFDAWVRIASGSYDAEDVGIYVYDVTNATTPVLIHEIADSSQTYAGPYSFITSGSSTSYRICVHVQTTNASAYTLNVDALYAGIERAAATTISADSGWTSYTPPGDPSGVTISAKSAWWKRQNTDMIIRGEFTYSAAPSTVVRYSFSDLLPPGHTFNASSWATAVANIKTPMGEFTFLDASAVSTSNDYSGIAAKVNSSGTQLTFIYPSGDELNSSVPIASVSGDSVSFLVRIPITEWSSPVYASPSGECEYAATGGTWDANDSTTVYGFNGQAMGGSLTGGREKTVTFTKPVRFIRILAGKTQGVWGDIDGAELGSGNARVVRNENAANTAYSGVYWRRSSDAAVVVTFGRYLRLSTDDDVTNWPSSDAYWVVENCPTPSASIIYSLASDSAAGLVNPYNTSTGVVYAGSTAPTLSAHTLISNSTVNPITWMRVGPVVTMGFRHTFTVSAHSDNDVWDFSTTIPVARTDGNFTDASDQVGGACAADQSAASSIGAQIYADVGAQTIGIQGRFDGTVTNTLAVSCHIIYHLEN